MQATLSKFRDVVSNFVHTAARGTVFLTRRGAAARSTPLTRRGAAARSTPLTAPVVAILSRTDRGHHVPALTVASGGRGVGFDMHAWGLPDHRSFEATSQPSSFISLFFSSFVLPPSPLGLGFLPGFWQPSEVSVGLIGLLGRRGLFVQYVATDAGPASHRVRLWQGGPASILTSSSGTL